MKRIVFVLLVGLVVTLSASAKPKLYRWVDEQGNVHYSDRVPPDQVKHARDELNDSGVVVDQVNREMTPEEREVARQIQQVEDTRLRLEEEQRQQEAFERKKILQSYVNEDQILRLKQERVEAIHRNLDLARENLRIQMSNHQDLRERAADKERSGEVVSEAFLGQLDKIADQIENQKRYIKEKEGEADDIARHYDEELQKYRKYTGVDSAAEPADGDSSD